MANEHEILLEMHSASLALSQSISKLLVVRGSSAIPPPPLPMAVPQAPAEPKKAHVPNGGSVSSAQLATEVRDWLGVMNKEDENTMNAHLLDLTKFPDGKPGVQLKSLDRISKTNEPWMRFIHTKVKKAYQAYAAQ